MSKLKQRPDPQKSLVGFAVGDVLYAVPIGCVRGIVNAGVVTQLPHAPDAVAGVADYRGEIVPMVDLRVRFAAKQNPDRRREKWVLIDVDGRTVGLIVDRVEGVFGTGGHGVRAAPPLGGGEDIRGIVGVTSHGNSMVFVLDVARFGTLANAIEETPLQLGSGGLPR
jgi:purine-binding chemotaxis protein CheW